MTPSTINQLARLLCPEFLRGPAQRLRKRVRVRLGSLRVVSTFDELDREIARIDQATQSEDHFRLLNEIIFDYPWTTPADPESPEYRRAVMESYYTISGRSSYQSAVNEQMSDLPEALPADRPYPYSTGSSRFVGEHLMAIGFLIRALDLAPGMRVLEFGPGWGNTTVELARLGAAVTAVDVNPAYLRLIGERCQKLAGAVDLVRADMLDYRPTKKFDRILFFECFHHCSDPVRMLEQMVEWLAPGGAIVFAGEPITDGFPVPWGLRTDGMSAYCIRKFGWLELGFNARFFKKLLTRRGWTIEVLQSMDMHRISVYRASRAESNQAQRAA
jgi:SAM-dependent methyltransferase